MNWYDDHPPIPRLFHSEITLSVLKIKTTHLPVSMMVINSMFGGGGGVGTFSFNATHYKLYRGDRVHFSFVQVMGYCLRFAALQRLSQTIY